jgi:hypothetical protein
VPLPVGNTGSTRVVQLTLPPADVDAAGQELLEVLSHHR